MLTNGSSKRNRLAYPYFDKRWGYILIIGNIHLVYENKRWKMVERR